MASTVIRTTYALDEETVRRLDVLARQWNASKSEASRRAIRTADAMAASPDDRLKALDELRGSMRLTHARAQTWVRECAMSVVGARRGGLRNDEQQSGSHRRSGDLRR